LMGEPLRTQADWLKAIRFYQARGVALVALSLGAEGVLAAYQGRCVHGQPPAITEVNPVGSGDALAAGFCMGLLEGWPLEDMVRQGCAMGTANAMSWDIGHFDAATVDRLKGEVKVTAVAA